MEPLHVVPPQGLPAAVTDLPRMQAHGHALYLAAVRTGAAT